MRLINEAFEFRIIIEKAAIRQFALTANSQVVKDFAKRTRSVLARIEKRNADDALLDEALEVDLALHAAIVDSLQNTLMTEAYRVLQDKIRLIRMNRKFSYERLPLAMKEHLDIISALSNHDPQTAEKALEQHLKTSWRRSLGTED